MSAKRAPSAPPQIPGYEHLSLVGSGGFSDVFLYQQQRPRRRVAVKVLLHEWSNQSQRTAFDAEADLMARLSSHPSIVTIYEADVAPDGRPYLAMEYCSRPSLGTRYRSERLGLAECLRVVVQVAGAVETAHRAGILHRDIKPANILGTDYGHPVLTDFGISSTLDDAARAEGLSIPWSPPESFEDPPRAGIGTDVWALGATLYTFLAGRSPFEVPGGSNSSADLVQRIAGQPLAPTGRSDVPASLENVLATSMAKDPDARYRSVLDFARALQQVQIELALGTTPIDILGDTGVVQHEVAVADEDDDEPGTRLRGVVSIDPSGPVAPARPAPGRAADAWSAGAVQQGARQTSGHDGAGPGAPAPAATPPTFVAPPPRLPQAPAAHRVAVVDPTGATDITGMTGATGVTGTVAPVPARGGATGAAGAGWAFDASRVDGAAGSFAAQHPQAPVPLEDTVLRPDPTDPADAPAPADEPRRGPSRLVAGIVAAVVVLGAAGAGVWALTRPDAATTQQTAADGPDGADDGGTADDGSGPSDNLGSIVPPVEDLAATRHGKDAVFTWTLPHAATGDTYAWRVLDPLQPTSLAATSKRSVTVPVGADGDVCVEVVVVRDGRQSAAPQHACLRERKDG